MVKSQTRRPRTGTCARSLPTPAILALRSGGGAGRATDPVELLEAAGRQPVPELVPIRYGRMLVSPFTFYRGAAAHGRGPGGLPRRHGRSCAATRTCNFGAFAAPDRRLVFDLNDFDETCRGRSSGTSSGWRQLRGRRPRPGLHESRARRQPERDPAPYREAMRGIAGSARLECGTPGGRRGDPRAWMTLADWKPARSASASRRTWPRRATKHSLEAFDKRWRVVDGKPQLVGDPPPCGAAGGPCCPSGSAQQLDDEMARTLFRSYRRSLPDDAASCWTASTTRLRPQGGRGRQRRHPRVDRADARRDDGIPCSCRSRRRRRR